MTNESLAVQLHSLVIFRNLLQNPVLKKLDTLLTVSPNDKFLLADAYGSFVAELFARSTDWSQFLMDAVLEDENLYIRAFCQNSSVDPALQDVYKRQPPYRVSPSSKKSIRGMYPYAKSNLSTE